MEGILRYENGNATRDAQSAKDELGDRHPGLHFGDCKVETAMLTGGVALPVLEDGLPCPASL